MIYIIYIFFIVVTRTGSGSVTLPIIQYGLNTTAGSMVFITDGCSFHYAHTWSKSGISSCWRHLVTSKESSNPKIFSEKTYFTSYVRNMLWATILYKYHGQSRHSSRYIKLYIYTIRKKFAILNHIKAFKIYLLHIYIMCPRNILLFAYNT